MKLISLTSPNPKFKDIKFKDGLNIIIGEKITSNKKESINGVGKTLSIKLISYMLGSQDVFISKILQETDTTLNLLVNINDKKHLITRDGKKVLLDEEEKNIKELREFLTIPNIPFSFRDIFYRFCRQSYNLPTQQLEQEESFKNNKVNAFLLKLNYELISQKEEYYNKQKVLNEIIKHLKQLDKEIDKEKILDLKSKIKKIESDLKNYTFAEDFEELQNEVDSLTKEIKQIRNFIAIKNREIKIREEIIKENSKEYDIDLKRIESIYKETQFFLPNEVKKHLEAVKEFHKTLKRNRIEEAKNDIKIFKKEIEILKNDMLKKDEKRAKLLKLLEGKKALEEYFNLQKEKELLQEELNTLLDKEQQIEKFKEEQAKLKIEIDKFKLQLIQKEKELESQIEYLTNEFRKISSLFYEKKPGVLDIKINDSMKSKYLYKIEPKIQGDESSGIGMIKIFIYDMLIYKLNHNFLGFVAHDNILFDSVDERQIATALDYAKKNLSQYICSINDTKFYNALKFSDKNLEKDIILKLTEKEKLFGVDF
ncbi:DUF2326 domain-containing protein [Nautilia sp.]